MFVTLIFVCMPSVSNEPYAFLPVIVKTQYMEIVFIPAAVTNLGLWINVSS